MFRSKVSSKTAARLAGQILAGDIRAFVVVPAKKGVAIRDVSRQVKTLAASVVAQAPAKKPSR